jgi:hypothetical protein
MLHAKSTRLEQHHVCYRKQLGKARRAGCGAPPVVFHTQNRLKTSNKGYKNAVEILRCGE